MGLLGWASSGITGDCGEVGLALAENLIEDDDGVMTIQSTLLGAGLVTTAGLE